MLTKLIKMLLIGLIVLTNIAYTQSYYYDDDLRKNERGFLVKNVYSIDLKTGEKELNLVGVGNPMVLSDISKIVFISVPQSEICVYDMKNGTTDTLSYLGRYEKVYQIHTVPPDNNIFFGLVKFDAKIINKELQSLETTEILIDKNSYSIIDTTSSYYKTSECVISRDGKKIYDLLDSADGLYFRSIDTETDGIINARFSIEGYENLQMKNKPYFIDSENGYIFIGYFSELDNLWHLVLCDPENMIGISEMTFPTGVPPYAKTISNSGDLIFQDGGIIYIFDGITTFLKQRLKFQTSDNQNAKSIIVMLGDSLYFFPEDPKESDATSFDNIGHADLTIVQTSSSLIEMLIDDVKEAKEKGWITNQGIVNSLDKKLENAKKQLEKGKTKTAINHLNAFLNEVEAQKDKHLTSEAYALLKFNAEYLVQRLEEE